MKRRSWLKRILAAGAGVTMGSAADTAGHSIQLHVDLTVDPAREQEMLKNFHNVFRPAASKQPGFIDAKMLKLQSTLAGAAPQGANYRFVLTFESEELRKQWVATPTHQKVWPEIEKTLSHKNYNVLLYDIA
jgi:heme-degrading monooxygenase HmoA